MRWIKWIVGIGLLLLLILFAFGKFIEQALRSDQPQMFAEPIYNTVVPALPTTLVDNQARPSVLLFSKTNGFRHREAIKAAATMFESMAARRGWLLYTTENAAVFNPESLANFDVVIASNATGPLFTTAQQRAFQNYLESGGGYVAIHSAGDGSHASWPWYSEQVIRARFTGHAILPQFQLGRVITERPDHMISQHLPSEWQHLEEWYCFEASPRAQVEVLLSLDETNLNFFSIDHRDGIRLRNLAMGSDHPVTWVHTVGGGRVFYTALGHAGDTFHLSAMQMLLEKAVEWTGRFTHPQAGLEKPSIVAANSE